MIPSFVNRPLVVSFAEFGETLLIIYPVADESLSAEATLRPLRLVRLSKALGDEKRLRILRALADGEKSLMELAEMFGVAKTTMHHHMIILRSAGLISSRSARSATGSATRRCRTWGHCSAGTSARRPSLRAPRPPAPRRTVAGAG